MLLQPDFNFTHFLGFSIYFHHLCFTQIIQSEEFRLLLIFFSSDGGVGERAWSREAGRESPGRLIHHHLSGRHDRNFTQVCVSLRGTSRSIDRRCNQCGSGAGQNNEIPATTTGVEGRRISQNSLRSFQVLPIRILEKGKVTESQPGFNHKQEVAAASLSLNGFRGLKVGSQSEALRS